MKSPVSARKAGRLAAHHCSRNLATGNRRGHRPAMRRLALASALLLAGCATRPQQPPAQEPAPAVPAPGQATRLVGLSASDLTNHFGRPALQVREGNSIKVQYRGRSCVLDAYLYPNASGIYRVTHVDTRSTSGADTDQASCISALEYPS